MNIVHIILNCAFPYLIEHKIDRIQLNENIHIIVFILDHARRFGDVINFILNK